MLVTSREHTVRRLGVIGLAALLLSGCAAVSRPSGGTIAALQADAVLAARAHDAVRDSVITRLVRRAVARGDRTLDVLLLSGGGQHGAYGVGYLRGWASRSDAPMPRFDLVSGISTGALQAPFALLGTPAALDTITALYRSAADRIAPTFDWWFWLRRTGGLVNTSRYERSLRNTVTPTLQAQLNAEFASGRQLLTATTDLDLGIGRVWDLTTELGTDSTALRRTHALLYTATAIPGIFPPRVLDGHVHGDGGIIANILPLLTLADYRTLAQRLQQAGVRDTVQVRVWVIMNLWTHALPKLVKPSSRGAISSRSTEILFWAAQPQVLQRLQELATAVSADVPGVSLQVRIAQPHASLATEPGAQKLFDRAWMQRIEQIGYEQARGATPWDSITSSYTRPQRP
jgi:predicted acylesterase/phospholipase RssA